MIINSIADATVKDGDIDFKFRSISYEIVGSRGRTIGEVASQEYKDVKLDNVGSGPYQVTLGYVNHSWEAKPVTVENKDAMCTFFMGFPAPPNGPKTFVYEPES